MIGQDELIKKAAESCGISPEISNYFFEVFINRLSSKLKPGEVLQFFNLGFFQKRIVRIPAEKIPGNQTGGSSLLTLILFSDEPEIKVEKKNFYPFRIADLKTLWENNQEINSALQAGDFAPYFTRSHLINSFATKAEVIISGLKKLIDVYEEEIVLSYSFRIKSDEAADNKANVISSTANPPKKDIEKTKPAESKLQNENKIVSKEKDKTEGDSSLPWGLGTKFYDKKAEQTQPEDFKAKSFKHLETGHKAHTANLKTVDDSNKKIDAEEALDAAIQESESDESLTKFKEFQPVKSRLALDDKNKLFDDEQFALRVKKKPDHSEKTESLKTDPKFTAVKSKTEVYHLQNDIKKLKKKQKFVEEPFTGSTKEAYKYKSYQVNKNLFPLIFISSLILVGVILIYFYFVAGTNSNSGKEIISLIVEPPENAKIIERDFEFAVTYPYTKTTAEIPIEGINPKVFLTEEIPPVKIEEIKPKKEIEVPVTETKVETKPEEKPKVEPKVEPKITEQKSSRIFLYNNYYVVFVGSYNSYTAADRAAEKYFDEGYNAFIEVEEVPGKPIKYNLNVGDFTSEAFARQFQEKYIK